MATNEQELAEAEEELKLVQAELDSNMEELKTLPVVSGMEQVARPMRVAFLTLRNTYLSNRGVKLQELVRAKRWAIDWEKRTR